MSKDEFSCFNILGCISVKRSDANVGKLLYAEAVWRNHNVPSQLLFGHNPPLSPVSMAKCLVIIGIVVLPYLGTIEQRVGLPRLE